jgi:hypothetical protein
MRYEEIRMPEKTGRVYPGDLGAFAAVEDRRRVMTVEEARDLRPVHRRRGALAGDSQEISSHVGVDVECMSPNAPPLTGVVTGGTILLAAAFLVLFTDLWRLIFILCWVVFLALGTFARGVAGLMESRQEERPPKYDKERELLEALRDRGELTSAQAAVETSLSVREADELLKELAEGGHLEVRVRGGALSYSLWEYEKDEARGIGGLRADHTL